MTLVAGHTWTDTPAGKACATCAMTRRRLHTATEADIKQTGWAHIGALTEDEYVQIVADRKLAAEEWDRIWDAVREVGEGYDVNVPELSVVSLTRAVEDDEGRPLPSGATGTVVHVYPDERAYLVEFNRPFHAVATVEADAITVQESGRATT